MAKAWGFVGATYPNDSVAIESQRTINLIPRFVESRSGLVLDAFEKAPGLRPVITGLDGPVRGTIQHGARRYAVGTTHFYELFWDWITETFTATERGTIPYTGRTAQIIPNGTEGNLIWLPCGLKGFIFDTADNSFTQITSPNYPARVESGTFLDGYFIAVALDTIVLSALNNGLTWNGDEAQKSVTTDPIRGVVTLNRNLLVQGSETTEVWYNNGDVYPFTIAPDGIIETGLAATCDACTTLNGTPMWFGAGANGGRIAYMAVGLSAKRISTTSIERVWRDYATVSDAYAWGYMDTGQAFFALTFPSEGATWVYDVLHDAWHERLYRNVESGLFEHHLSRCAFYAEGRHFVGSRRDGTIYELRADVYLDDGDPLRWVRRAPHIANEKGMLYLNGLILEVETGTAALTGNGSAPLAGLRMSVDQGHTFGPEVIRPYGARGEYGRVVHFGPLGAGRGAVLEVAGNNNCPEVIADAYLDLSPGLP